MVERLTACGMLSTSDQELISCGYSLYQRNYLLLGFVQQLPKNALSSFCEMVKEVHPKIGSQLVTGNIIMCAV